MLNFYNLGSSLKEIKFYAQLTWARKITFIDNKMYLNEASFLRGTADNGIWPGHKL